MIPCRGFVLCTGYLTPNETFRHPNKASAEVTHAVYMVFGGGVAASEGKQPIELTATRLTSLYDFAGTEIIYTAGPDGAAWIAVNPTPETKQYQTQLVPEGSSIDVTADGTECAVVCLFGGITVGGKTITALNYARILPGKVAALEVPQNSTALILKVI